MVLEVQCSVCVLRRVPDRHWWDTRQASAVSGSGSSGGESVFGEMHGREKVRNWIVPLMKTYPNDRHDWVLFDEENGCVVLLCTSTATSAHV